jgi:hypothetical protein
MISRRGAFFAESPAKARGIDLPNLVQSTVESLDVVHTFSGGPHTGKSVGRHRRLPVSLGAGGRIALVAAPEGPDRRRRIEIWHLDLALHPARLRYLATIAL